MNNLPIVDDGCPVSCGFVSGGGFAKEQVSLNMLKKRDLFVRERCESRF